MDEFLPRGEHDEYAKRIDAENERQNKRIGLLEENVRQISALTISIEKMATSMETMAKELGNQGDRLEALEQEPAKRWKDSTKALFNAFLGAIGTAAAGGVIYLLTLIK